MENLYDLLVFTTVARCGSLSAAARELRVSPSVVSRRLAALEQRLGTELVYRSTRRVVVADAAVPFYRRCDSLFGAIEDATSDFSRSLSSASVLLRVGSALGLGQRMLTTASTAFIRRHPHVRIEYRVVPLRAEMLDSEVDVLVSQRRLGRSGKIHSVEIAPIRYVVCASPDYIAEHGTPRSPAELVFHNCLVHEHDRPAVEWRFDDRSAVRRVRVQGSLLSNNGVALHEAALRGLGIVRMPDYAIHEDIAEGRLVVLFDTVAGMERGLVATTLARPQYNPTLDAYLTHLGAYIRTQVLPAGT